MSDLRKKLDEARERILFEFIQAQVEPDRSKLMAAWSQAREHRALCDAVSVEGFACCCLTGHEGEHLAIGRIGTIFARWTS